MTRRRKCWQPTCSNRAVRPVWIYQYDGGEVRHVQKWCCQEHAEWHEERKRLAYQKRVLVIGGDPGDIATERIVSLISPDVPPREASAEVLERIRRYGCCCRHGENAFEIGVESYDRTGDLFGERHEVICRETGRPCPRAAAAGLVEMYSILNAKNI